MKSVKIRFNTTNKNGNDLWRIIVDNVEYLTKSIVIYCQSFTTMDKVFDSDKKEYVDKFHISCKAMNVSITDELTIIE